MFSAIWEQALNMAEPAEIARVLQPAGPDAQRLLEASQLAEVKEGLLANTHSAFDRGAFGSPTFFVDSEMFFGKERLGQVELDIARAVSA